MVAAQYTILRNIFPGHHNWQELVGVTVVVIASISLSIYDIVKMYCLQNNDSPEMQ